MKDINIEGQKEKPLVSIITPSYNQGRFLEKTIQSILTQDYPHIEHIVIDGGSTDDSMYVLKKYDDKIKWYSEKDRGQTHAVNKGFTLSNGEIIGWVNSDDILLQGTVREIVNHFISNINTYIVYGRAYYIDEFDKIMYQYPTQKFNANLLQEICFICQPALFMRKEVFKKIGLLNENLNYCMDYDYWIRASKLFRFDYIEKNLAAVRIHKTMKTLTNKVEALIELMKMLRDHYGIIPLPVIYGYENMRLPVFRRLFGLLSVPIYFIFAVLNFIKMNRKFPIYGPSSWLRWSKKMFKGTKIGTIDL